MRLTFLTPSLIGSIYGGVYHLTNRQVVLMGLSAKDHLCTCFFLSHFFKIPIIPFDQMVCAFCGVDLPVVALDLLVKALVH